MNYSFNCEVCGKTFTRRNNAYRHVRSSHGEEERTWQYVSSRRVNEPTVAACQSSPVAAEKPTDIMTPHDSTLRSLIAAIFPNPTTSGLPSATVCPRPTEESSLVIEVPHHSASQPSHITQPSTSYASPVKGN